MKIIGIIGPTFCGSTIVGRLLSSIPGVIAPGDLRWMFEKYPGDTCYICKNGKRCTKFNSKFIQKTNRQNAYGRVARLLSPHKTPKALVSGDKSVAVFKRYKRKPDYYILLLRKFPSHVASLSRYYSSEMEALNTFQFWLNEELKALKRQDTPFAIVSLERFLKSPTSTVEWLSVVSGGIVPEPCGKVRLPAPSHMVGGNSVGVASTIVDPSLPDRRKLRQISDSRVNKTMSPVLLRIMSADAPKLLD